MTVICLKIHLTNLKKEKYTKQRLQTTLNRNIDIFSENVSNEELFLVGFFFTKTSKIYYNEFIPLSEWRDKQINSILEDE
jgi:hypothetical protein